MSTAWYKPNVVPKLLKSFPSNRGKQIDVWSTTCIVTNFGKTTEEPKCSVLINPANPSLSGVKKFPYFPRGGPEPNEAPKKYEHHIMGYVSQWGGMEVGSGMVFPANVVDGLVHQLGGWKLAMHCHLTSLNDEKCPVGHAVSTYPGGNDLQKHYDEIIHTVPPFYNHHPSPDRGLAQCYKSSLELAFLGRKDDDDDDDSHTKTIAFPLLGAGARGFPLQNAIDIAAVESRLWRDEGVINEEEDPRDVKQVLAFGIPDIKIAERLIDAIEQYDHGHERQ